VRALEAVIVSAIARVEVPAALWRKERLGELDAAQAEVLVQAFACFADELRAAAARSGFALVPG
jgi:hypothetical protein